MRSSSALRELLWPLLFIISLGYLAWYAPRLIVFFGGATDALKARYDTAGLPEFAAVFMAAASLILGIATIRPALQEGTNQNVFDRASLFMGRVTMLFIVVLVCVMFFEVISRYIFEAPTIWANGVSLWIAGAIFLMSGLYSMQQRAHIRIFLLYDMMPRNVQRVCDLISTALIVAFAIILVWGGFNEAYDKFFRWETFYGAVNNFDPPIPATIKPLLLLFISLVAVQAVVNLICDWGKEREVHAVVDEGEIEEFVQEMGAKLKDKG